MFGKKKSKKHQNTKPSEIRTIIGEECEFDGEIKTSSSTRIDGKFKGIVNCENSLIVGELGKVSGELKAYEIIIYGNVEGSIESKRLEIKNNGTIIGDIFTESLIVEDGGTYNGKCVMSRKDDTIMIQSYSENNRQEIEKPNNEDETTKALGN